MIVVAGTLTYDPADHAGVRQAVLTVAAETRNEPGNVSYEFFADLNGPGRMLVFEEWESDEALRAHAQSAHIQAFRQELKQYRMLGRDITRYVVTETSKI